MSPVGTGDPAAGAASISVNVGPGPTFPYELYRRADCDGAGAVVQFRGVARNHHGGVGVRTIEYEAVTGYRGIPDRVKRQAMIWERETVESGVRRWVEVSLPVVSDQL